MTVEAESEEGYKRTYTFQNADVTVPILSIGLLTYDGNDVLCQKRGGNIIHVPSGEEIAFVRRHCVYFIKFKFDWDGLQPTLPDSVCAPCADQDFGAGKRP